MPGPVIFNYQVNKEDSESDIDFDFNLDDSDADNSGSESLDFQQQNEIALFLLKAKQISQTAQQVALDGLIDDFTNLLERIVDKLKDRVGACLVTSKWNHYRSFCWSQRNINF